MPRITPDLVACSLQFTNPILDREIKLRALKIPAIENLGATQDQFDTVDLSDNEIRKLEVRGLPPMPTPSFLRQPLCWNGLAALRSDACGASAGS